MSWFKRQPVQHAIPNPRDKRKRQDTYEQAQLNVLRALQFFDFAIALVILAEVCR